MKKILVIGYGNPGRLDDGLGPALAARLSNRALPHVTVDSDYQLNVEDAQDIAQHDVVIFADASVIGQEAYTFHPVAPKQDLSFTSHSVEPEAVLAMARDMFQADAQGYALGIRGYEFNEFGERLSRRATANLDAAVDFIVGKIAALQEQEKKFDKPG